VKRRTCKRGHLYRIGVGCQTCKHFGRTDESLAERLFNAEFILRAAGFTVIAPREINLAGVPRTKDGALIVEARA